MTRKENPLQNPNNKVSHKPHPNTDTLNQFCATGFLNSSEQYWGFPGGSEVKASACNAGDLGSIPGSGRSPGEGNGNPLQYSCLENPMDGGSWWATVHGVAKSQTRLSDFTSRHFKKPERGLPHNIHKSKAIKNSTGTSLVVQWLRIHLAMQGMQVQSLVGELGSHVHWGN